MYRKFLDNVLLYKRFAFQADALLIASLQCTLHPTAAARRAVPIIEDLHSAQAAVLHPLLKGEAMGMWLNSHIIKLTSVS